MRAGEYFYRTQAWADCRKAYKKYAGGLCERCKANGRINAGEIVHHKIHLSSDNLNDTSITLSFDNLELLCRKCHADEHPELYRHKNMKRYTVDENGRVFCNVDIPHN